MKAGAATNDSDGERGNFRNPPVEHRFKKGQSGNPKGRPRGSRSFKTELREIIEHRIPVTSDGRKTKMTVRKAILAKLRQQALAGDHKSMDRLLRLCEVHLPEDDTPVSNPIAGADRAILDALLADLRDELDARDEVDA